MARNIKVTQTTIPPPLVIGACKLTQGRQLGIDTPRWYRIAASVSGNGFLRGYMQVRVLPYFLRTKLIWPSVSR